MAKVLGNNTHTGKVTGGPVVSPDTTFVPSAGDASTLQSGRESHQVDLKLDKLAKLTHDLQLAKYQGLETKGLEDELKLGLEELKKSGVDTAKIEEGLGAYGEELRKEIEIADKLKALSEEKLSREEVERKLDEIPGVNKTEALKMLAKLELEAEANLSKGSLRIVANKRDGADALKLDLSLSLDHAVPNESARDKVHRLNLQRTRDERVDALLSKYPEFLSREKVDETIRGTEKQGLVDLYLSKTKNMPWIERRTELLNAGVFTEETEGRYRETLFRKEASEVLSLLDARYERGLYLTPADKGDSSSQSKVKAATDRIRVLEAQLDRMIADVPERLVPILGEELKFLRLKAGEAEVQGLAAYQGFKEGEEAKALAAYEKAAIEGGALFATTQILTNARDAFPKLLESSTLLVGGNLAQLGGFLKGAATFKNPLTSARDWGSSYVEGSRDFFNKNAWGGSTFGGDEAFSSKSLYSMALKDMNPVAHFGDAVVSPAFSLIDVGRVEISRRQIVGRVLFGNIQVVADVYYGTDSDPIADLTYSQYRELEQTDPLLKEAKYSFQVAEISASLAMGRPESVGGMVKMLSGSAGMGVVGSAGRELMREDGKFEFGTFLENTLSQTADSSVFMAGMSGFSSLFVRSRIGDIGSKLVRGEALTHAELKLLNSTQKQAVLMRELVDNIDGLGDLSGSVENFQQVKTTRQGIGAILNFLTAASDVGDVNLGLGDRVGNGVDGYLANRLDNREKGRKGSEGEVSVPVVDESAVEKIRSDLTGLEGLSLTEVDSRTKEEILRTPAVALRQQESKYDKPVSEILNYKNSRDEVRAEYVLARTNELVSSGVSKEQAEAKALTESRRVVAFFNQETKSITVERPRTLKEGESPSQKERLLDAFLVKHELDHYKQDPNLSMIEGETQSLLKRASELNKLGFDLVLTESGSWSVVELASKDKPILVRDPGYFQRAVERTHGGIYSGVGSTTLNLMSEGEVDGVVDQSASSEKSYVRIWERASSEDRALFNKCTSLGREGNVKDVIDNLRQYQFKNLSSDELIVLIVRELLSPKEDFSPYEDFEGEIISIGCVKEILKEFPLNQDSLDQAIKFALRQCVVGIDYDSEMPNIRFIYEACEIVKEFNVAKSVLADTKYLEALDRYVNNLMHGEIDYDDRRLFIMIIEHLHPNLDFVKTWLYQQGIAKAIINSLDVGWLRLGPEYSTKVYDDYGQVLKLLPSPETLENAHIAVLKTVLISYPDESTGILEILIDMCGISEQAINMAYAEAFDHMLDFGVNSDDLKSLLKNTDSASVNKSLLRRPYTSFKLLENGIFGDAEMEKCTALGFLKRLSGLKYPSSNADNDPWRHELAPLMQHFIRLSSILDLDPVDTRSQDIFCDYVNRFGMLNLPKLFELNLAVSRLASPTELKNPEHQKIRDSLQVILKKDPATFSGSKAILNGLKSYKDTFTARLVKCDKNGLRRLQSELEGSVLAKELFQLAIGSSQFSTGNDPVSLVNTLVSRLESEPEKFDLKEHEVEREIQVSVMRATSGSDGDTKVNISRILAGEKYQVWRESVVGAITKSKEHVIDEKDIAKYFKEDLHRTKPELLIEYAIRDAIRLQSVGQADLVSKVRTGLGNDQDSLKALHDWIFGYFNEHYLGGDGPSYLTDEAIETIQLILDLLDPECSILRRTLSAVEEIKHNSKVRTGKKDNVRLIPTKLLGRVFSGDISDACTTALQGSFARGEYEDVTSYVLVSGNDNNMRIEGTVLAVTAYTPEGKKVLHIRANNPKERLRSIYDTDELVEGIVDCLIQSAEEGGYDLVTLPLDAQNASCSNRGYVHQNYHSKYKDAPRIKLNKTPATGLNGYDNWNPKGLHPSVVIWARDKEITFLSEIPLGFSSMEGQVSRSRRYSSSVLSAKKGSLHPDLLLKEQDLEKDRPELDLGTTETLSRKDVPLTSIDVGNSKFKGYYGKRANERSNFSVFYLTCQPDLESLHSELSKVRRANSDSGETAAFYDVETRTIYAVQPMAGESEAETKLRTSILAHEVDHGEGQLDEVEAYLRQAEFLDKNGYTIQFQDTGYVVRKKRDGEAGRDRNGLRLGIQTFVRTQYNRQNGVDYTLLSSANNDSGGKGPRGSENLNRYANWLVDLNYGESITIGRSNPVINGEHVFLHVSSAGIEPEHLNIRRIMNDTQGARFLFENLTETPVIIEAINGLREILEKGQAVVVRHHDKVHFSGPPTGGRYTILNSLKLTSSLARTRPSIINSGRMEPSRKENFSDREILKVNRVTDYGINNNRITFKDDLLRLPSGTYDMVSSSDGGYLCNICKVQENGNYRHLVKASSNRTVNAAAISMLTLDRLAKAEEERRSSPLKFALSYLWPFSSRSYGIKDDNKFLDCLYSKLDRPDKDVYKVANGELAKYGLEFKIINSIALFDLDEAQLIRLNREHGPIVLTIPGTSHTLSSIIVDSVTYDQQLKCNVATIRDPYHAWSIDVPAVSIIKAYNNHLHVSDISKFTISYVDMVSADRDLTSPNYDYLYAREFRENKSQRIGVNAEFHQLNSFSESPEMASRLAEFVYSRIDSEHEYLTSGLAEIRGKKSDTLKRINDIFNFSDRWQSEATERIWAEAALLEDRNGKSLGELVLRQDISIIKGRIKNKLREVRADKAGAQLREFSREELSAIEENELFNLVNSRLNAIKIIVENGGSQETFNAEAKLYNEFVSAIASSCGLNTQSISPKNTNPYLFVSKDSKNASIARLFKEIPSLTMAVSPLDDFGVYGTPVRNPYKIRLDVRDLLLGDYFPSISDLFFEINTKEEKKIWEETIFNGEVARKIEGDASSKPLPLSRLIYLARDIAELESRMSQKQEFDESYIYLRGVLEKRIGELRELINLLSNKVIDEDVGNTFMQIILIAMDWINS